MLRNDVDKLFIFVNGLANDKKQGKDPEVFTGFEKRITRGEESDWLRSQLLAIKQGDMISVLAELDGRVVANGDIHRGHYRETRHYGRLGLTVSSECRGMGIGREMVKTLLREARRLDLKNIEVEFLAKNQAAIHTYQRAGFKEAGQLPGKVLRNGKFLDSVIMMRQI